MADVDIDVIGTKDIPDLLQNECSSHFDTVCNQTGVNIVTHDIIESDDRFAEAVSETPHATEV